MSAVNAAEAFVLRHGFTDIPHPNDQPVENVAHLDVVSTPQELLERRQNLLQPKAIGFVRESLDSYSVLFRTLKDPSDVRGIWVQDGRATRLVNSWFHLNEIDWVSVPANNSLQRP
jgi:hypothetical protein